MRSHEPDQPDLMLHDSANGAGPLAEVVVDVLVGESVGGPIGPPLGIPKEPGNGRLGACLLRRGGFAGVQVVKKEMPHCNSPVMLKLKLALGTSQSP